jgi:CRISPR-associated protein Csx3
MINFKMTENEKFSLIEFELEGGAMTPFELAELNPPTVNPRKGVVLSGRGPIWLYATLAHHYHATLWVGCYDPRVGGVVTQTHSPDYNVGQIVSLD